MRYRYDIAKGIQKVKTKTDFSLRTFLIGLGGFGIAVAIPFAAHAANGNGPSPNWHVGYYNPGGRALSMAQAMSSLSGLASFNFTDGPNTALLITSQGSQKGSSLGDLSTKSVSSSYTVSNLNGSFNYYGEPSCGGTTANVRYFFETSNAGGFDETHYWWSNPYSLPLSTGSATLPTVSFTGNNWSDFYGHFGNDSSYADGFQAAVSNVTDVGLSFGGGCFFENGVGTSDGSGTFTLNTFTVQ